MSNKTIALYEKNVLAAYAKASPEKKAEYEMLYGKELFNRKITDIATSFEAVCEISGADPKDPKFHVGAPDDVAYQRLKLITEVLNEGVIIDPYNGKQDKWYPWHECSSSGFRFHDAYYAYSYSTVGSRLCTVSRELAIFSGTQFINEWENFKTK